MTELTHGYQEGLKKFAAELRASRDAAKELIFSAPEESNPYLALLADFDTGELLNLLGLFNRIVAKKPDPECVRMLEQISSAIRCRALDSFTQNALREEYKLVALYDVFIQAGCDPNATIVVPLPYRVDYTPTPSDFDGDRITSELVIDENGRLVQPPFNAALAISQLDAQHFREHPNPQLAPRNRELLDEVSLLLEEKRKKNDSQ